MRTSTVAAILAFTTGMTANAAPVVLPDVLSDASSAALDTVDALGAQNAPRLAARACALEPGGDPLQCNDVIFVDQTIQDQTSEKSQAVTKREPQRGRGGGRGRAGRVGGVVEGTADGVGAVADGIFIGQTIQDQTAQGSQPVAKREPQRGQPGRVGNAGICQVGIKSPCNGDLVASDF